MGIRGIGAQTNLVLAVAALVLAGCSADTATPTTPPLEPHDCEAEPGSATDLAFEPVEWLRSGDYKRWTDTSGCEVRIDVISHVDGVEHCEWQSAQFITVGRPFGASIRPYTDDTIDRYVWDPEGVLPGGPIAHSLDAGSLPETAQDSGYRRQGASLWIDTDDGTVLYVVHGGVADVWRRDLVAGLCD